MIVGALWRDRIRAGPGLAGWAKTWAKRLFTLGSLLRSAAISRRLSSGGAKLGNVVLFGRTRIIGRPSLLAIDDHAFIGNVEITLHAQVTIGKYVVINDHSRLITATHDVSSPTWRTTAQPIVVEDFAWIAEGASILPGVRIGWGAVVGLGAVVSRDVERCTVVVGNPARPTGRRRPDNLVYDPIRSVAFVEAWLGRPAAAPASSDTR